MKDPYKRIFNLIEYPEPKKTLFSNVWEKICTARSHKLRFKIIYFLILSIVSVFGIFPIISAFHNSIIYSDLAQYGKDIGTDIVTFTSLLQPLQILELIVLMAFMLIILYSLKHLAEDYRHYRMNNLIKKTRIDYNWYDRDRP